MIPSIAFHNGNSVVIGLIQVNAGYLEIAYESSLLVEVPSWRTRSRKNTRNWETVMSLPLQSEEIPQRFKGPTSPCETPGCRTNCAYAYSCYERGMGRTRVLAWPLVGLAIVLVIGIFF
jgi:hypothetical protein